MRNLVKEWISIGRHGRFVGSLHSNFACLPDQPTNVHLQQAYFGKPLDVGNIPIPDYIPTNLSVFEKRRTVDPDAWSDAGAIWIRTWYGNGADDKDTPVQGSATRASADAAYLRLWQKALWPPDKAGFDDNMFGPYVFDDNDAAYGVWAQDADNEVELMDDIPSFILNALVRCPDAMEGGSGRDTVEEDELMWSQALLVVVADGEACEDGWVLLIAINDKGKVLHKRVRCKASEVGQNVAFWKDGGEPLDIETRKENVIEYRDANQSGNGWDDEEPL